MKKLVSVLAVFLIFGVVFAGCTDVENIDDPADVGMSWDDSLPEGYSWDAGGYIIGPDGSKVNSESSKRPAPKDDSGKTTIIVWIEPDDDSIKVAMKNFEKAHPDIEVKLENNMTVDIEAVSRAMSSGQAPDIMRLDHVYIVGFGRNGDLLDLNKYGAGNIKSQFIDSCWNGVSFGNAVYGIPGDANTIALMYNADMLNIAGKTVNDLKTYEGMKEVCREMKKTSPEKTPIMLPFFDTGNMGRSSWSPFNFFFWIWSEGGDILSPDCKKAIFNQQPGVDALTKLVSFPAEGLTKTQYLEQEFYRGQVGMIQMGSWAIPALLNNQQAPNLSATTMPVLKEGVPGYSGLGLYAWGVTKKKAKTRDDRSEKMNQACFDFLETFLTDEALQVSWARKRNFLPTTKAAIANKYFTSNAVWSAYSKQLQIAKSRPGVVNWLQIEGQISKAINEAVSSKNVTNALNNAAERVNDLLK